MKEIKQDREDRNMMERQSGERKIVVEKENK